jgi:thiol-disulfide isomerase/thioredoxin
MLLRAFICAAFLVRGAFPQCEATGTAKEVLDANSKIPAAQKDDRIAALDKALGSDPTDYFLLDRLRSILDEDKTREALLDRLAALYQKYPDSPAVAVVYADELRNKDETKALAILQSVEKDHADFPFTHFKLLQIFGWGRLQNKARLAEEIDAYLKACPAVGTAYVYRVLLDLPAEQIARHAGLLRARLEAETGAANQQLWSVLWDLEFKAVPPTGHAAVRQRIAKDLEKLEQAPGRDKLGYLTFLRNGYNKLGDKAASDRIADQILKDYPKSRETESLVTDRWYKEHPFPRDGDKAAQEAWYRANLVAAREWRTKWPANNMWFHAEFSAMAALDDTKPEDLSKLAGEYVADYQKRGNWYGALPTEFDVADALLKKKLTPAVIPDWIEEGYRRETNRSSRMLGSMRDNLTDDQKKMADRQVANIRIERARILLDYYDAIGQPAKSRGIEDAVSGVNPPEELKPKLYEVKAKAAEMDNRKLDALVLYRAARDLLPERDAVRKRELDMKVESLWKDLGGTYAARSVFTGNKLEPVGDIHWETPKNTLSAFSLVDLDGKTWKLADLNGRAVLINVWATWCGPCRAEHPEFQKLYDKLKDRKDIAVLSVSVDESVGLVAPYMKDNHYTFPVVFGKDLMEATGVEAGIPQNWFLSTAGKLDAVQVGYGASPEWAKTITGKLDELLQMK